MAFRTNTYILPGAWAVALLYSDDSPYEADEDAAIDKFIASVVARHGHAHFSMPEGADDPGFLRWHDAAGFWPYGANCAEFELLTGGA